LATSSYWLEEPAQPFAAPAASGHVDVAVIGGGVTGCSCALTLARHGVSVRLYEARTVAGGAGSVAASVMAPQPTARRAQVANPFSRT